MHNAYTKKMMIEACELSPKYLTCSVHAIVEIDLKRIFHTKNETP